MSKKEKDILSESNINDNDFQVLKYLDNTQITSQREISKSLNISLGKIKRNDSPSGGDRKIM